MFVSRDKWDSPMKEELFLKLCFGDIGYACLASRTVKLFDKTPVELFHYYLMEYNDNVYSSKANADNISPMEMNHILHLAFKKPNCVYNIDHYRIAEWMIV